MYKKALSIKGDVMFIMKNPFHINDVSKRTTSIILE